MNSIDAEALDASMLLHLHTQRQVAAIAMHDFAGIVSSVEGCQRAIARLIAIEDRCAAIGAEVLAQAEAAAQASLAKSARARERRRARRAAAAASAPATPRRPKEKAP